MNFFKLTLTFLAISFVATPAFATDSSLTCGGWDKNGPRYCSFDGQNRDFISTSYRSKRIVSNSSSDIYKGRSSRGKITRLVANKNRISFSVVNKKRNTVRVYKTFKNGALTMLKQGQPVTLKLERGVLQKKACGADKVSSNLAHAGHSARSSETPQALAGTAGTISITLYVSKTMSDNVSNARDKVETIASTVDAIYESDLGFSFAATIVELSDAPWGATTDINDELNNFSDWWSSNAPSGADAGASITDVSYSSIPSNGGAAGIAWLGSICRFSGAFSTSINEFISTTITAVILAHEVGHNAGAGHDTQSPGTIMFPSANPNSTNFSPDSQDAIADYFADKTCQNDGESTGGGGETDGGGDESGGDQPEVDIIVAKAKVIRRGGFKARFTISQLNTDSLAGCTVSVYGSKSEADVADAATMLANATLLTTLISSDFTDGKEKLRTSKLKKGPKKDTYYNTYLACSDYTYVGTPITMGNKSSSARKFVKGKKWVNSIANAL